MDILSLLEAKGIEYVHKGQDEIAIPCPNAAVGHSDGIDTTMSNCFINLKKQVLNCFACSFKLGQVGLTRWLMGEDLDEMQIKAISIKSKLNHLHSEEEELFVENKTFFQPPGIAFNRDYRGIKAETYNKLGAIECTRGFYENRVCFPINQDGKVLGYDCRTLAKVLPKYLRPKGCDAQKWLYPLDLAREAKIKRAILAEGIFHSINYLDKMGIPETLAYFGRHNYTTYKTQLLLGLGVEEVIVFPDNDKAGWDVAIEIAKEVQDWFPVRVVNVEKLEEGKDLGDLTRDEILDVMKDLRRLR